MKNSNSLVEKFSGALGLWTQCSAIIALAITILLFLNRIIVCVYYHLPIIYGSLSLLSVIPLALGFALGVIYTLSYLDEIYNMTTKKVSYLKKSNEKEQDIYGVVIDVYVDFILMHMPIPFLDKIWNTLKQKIKKNIRKKNKNNTSEKHKQKIKKSHIVLSRIIIIVLFIDFLVLFFQEALSFDVFDLFLVGLFFLPIVCALELYLLFASWSYVLTESLEIESKKGIQDIKVTDGVNMVKKGNDGLLIKSKHIFLYLLLFGSIISMVTTAQALRTISKGDYSIVESLNNTKDQQYAIVLDLDNYFVIEPIKDNGSEIVIDISRFMYIRKENVMVTHKKYSRVLKKRLQQ